MDDSEFERLRSPEHKWIANLQRYVERLRFELDYYWFTEEQADGDFDWIQEMENDRDRRKDLIRIYTQRITPCTQGTSCRREDCPYFHSKAHLLFIKNSQENEKDRLLYLDKFHELMTHLKPFFINEIASLVREYCCNPTILLTKVGLQCSTALNLVYFIAPVRRKPMNVDRFERCMCCDEEYDQYDPEKTLYNLTKDLDDGNQDYIMFDEHCGKTYLGLNTVTISLSMPMQGWKLRKHKVFSEHKWYVNLERYRGQQDEKLYSNVITLKQYDELKSDLKRWKALLLIFQERLKLRLDCS
jgi:hypothetical protein